MVKRFGPIFGSIMLCLLSIIYSSYLVAELEPYKWTLKKGDIVEHEGVITLIQNNHRTCLPAISGSSCEGNNSDNYPECYCGCENPGSAAYSEEFILNASFNQVQSQPQPMIPSIFHSLLGEGNDDFYRTYILSYRIQSQSTVFRNLVASCSCLFFGPFHWGYMKCMEESYRRNRELANEGLRTATPSNLPHGITITNRAVYMNDRAGQSFAGAPLSVPPSAGMIMNLFLNNSEALHWLRFYLDSLPPSQTNPSRVNLSRNVWMPELADTPMSANIQIQRHAQVLFLQPESGIPLRYPTHHMRLHFPSNNITAEYHILHVANQATEVLGVIITQEEYSLRVEQRDYNIDEYRMPPPYEPVQPMAERPGIQHSAGSHFSPSSGSGGG